MSEQLTPEQSEWVSAVLQALGHLHHVEVDHDGFVVADGDWGRASRCWGQSSLSVFLALRQTVYDQRARMLALGGAFE